MQQPLVTVITVTYNSAKFVRDTIESVLAQTYSPIEYIIADDHSRDNTWEIISEYNDPRIRAYQNEVNLGEYNNRNKAIDLAKGEYLLFIDGDDIIFPHGIGYFTEMMNLFPMAGMAIQKGYINNVLFPALLYPREALSNHYLGQTDLLSSSFASNFFRTAVIREVGKLNAQLATGDNDIRVKIAARFPVLFIAGWVSWPRETPGQAASRVTPDKLLAEFAAYTSTVMRQPSETIDKLLLEDIQRSVKRKIARYALREMLSGRPRKAGALLKKVGMDWKDVRQHYNFRPVSKDVLEKHDAINPFNRGFLYPARPLNE